MNAKVYLNLLESDFIVKEDREYNFAMMPPSEHDRFLAYVNEELAEASVKITSYAINSLSLSL